MRRTLSLLLLLGIAVLLPLRADALTVVPPGDGGSGQLLVGDPVLLSGSDKAAGTMIRIWDGGAYTGCFPNPLTDSTGDWQCQVSGPFQPGTYDWEAREIDSAGNQVGATQPFSFTVRSVFALDPGSLKFTPKKPIVLTGTTDPGEGVTATITRPGDATFKRDLSCTVSDDRFRCAEGRSTRTAARALRPAVLPQGSYSVTLTEIDVELGPFIVLQQGFEVGPPPAVPTPPATPKPPKPTKPPTQHPTSDPTTAPPIAPSATPTASPTSSPAPPSPSATSTPTAVTPFTPPPPVAAPPVTSSAPRPPSGPDLSLLVGLLIMAFTTLSIAGGRAFASVWTTSTAVTTTADGATLPLIADAGSEDNDLDREVDHRLVAGWGDRSWTWRLPGYRFADAFGRFRPRRIARVSPLVGRLIADAGYLRSMLGIAWLLPLVAAAVLAGMSLADVSGRPLPPTAGLLVAVIVVACLDALAGAVAVAVLWIGVLVDGRLGDDPKPNLTGSIAVLLVLGVLWMALPLIGSATRPFRRRSDPQADEPGRSYRWDRLADLAIAAPLCGWVAYKLAQALSPFAGLDLPVADHAALVGYATAGGVALRFALEEVAEHGYPRRLHQVELPGSLPDPTRWADLGGVLVRSTMLWLLAYVFLGSCWQLWVGMAIVTVLAVAAVFGDAFPKSPKLGTVLPRGITKMLVMSAICTVVAQWATDGRVGLDQLRDCFVIMSIPSGIVSALKLFAVTPEPRTWNWPQQLAGAGVYVAMILVIVYGW